MSKILKSAFQYKGPISENLTDFIRIGLRKNAEHTLVIDAASGRRWTGAILETHITRIAEYLRKECQLQKGDICTIYNEPNDQSVILMLAIISAGGTSNFLSNKYRPRDILDTSKRLGSHFLISTQALLENLKCHLSGENDECSITKVLSIDGVYNGYGTSFGPIGHLLLCDQASSDSSLKATLTLDDLAAEVDPSQLAVVQFSGGTTGKPKPIPRTHKNLCHLVASVDHEELMDLKPGQILTGSLQLTHRPGIWALLASINGGSTYLVWDSTSDIEDALRLIDKYQVTIFSASLPMLGQLGNKGISLKNKYNLASLQQIITSGSKIVHEDLPKSIVKEFKLQSLRQCFGMTESGWVFLLERSLAKAGNYLTVGHVVPGSEVAILDRGTMQPVGPDVRGELAVRGPQVFPGYMDGERFVYNRKDFLNDDWFRTGDQARYDAQELVFIEGRYKELMIFANNIRAFPNEIETILSEHPAIECACVVNMGQNNGFDVARGFVTLKQNCQVTEKELIDFVSERFVGVMMDGGIKILDKFPRLHSGKVDKFALKEMVFDS
uniref:Putative 4-coumarate--CoA ligase 2 n=1 Tax=Aceria tosichella TaxID=561515 RepID=A0A6G1SAJ5_9ACAR